MKQTAIEWFTNQLEKHYVFQDLKNTTAFLHAKEMEREQKGYTEEQAKQIWKAGQEYWKTSGSSTTFEELTETFNTNEK
jgi:hypothetical protein